MSWLGRLVISVHSGMDCENPPTDEKAIEDDSRYMSWASAFTTTHMNMHPHRDAHTYASRHIHTHGQSRHTSRKMEKQALTNK